MALGGHGGYKALRIHQSCCLMASSAQLKSDMEHSKSSVPPSMLPVSSQKEKKNQMGTQDAISLCWVNPAACRWSSRTSRCSRYVMQEVDSLERCCWLWRIVSFSNTLFLISNICPQEPISWVASLWAGRSKLWEQQIHHIQSYTGQHTLRNIPAAHKRHLHSMSYGYKANWTISKGGDEQHLQARCSLSAAVLSQFTCKLLPHSCPKAHGRFTVGMM